ncbi:DUF6477 family protein [Sulfitobacter aestuarii]|uniref:DUF6477 family protein n=1 Tax=Sulfitobacter aestuarii TaxID=2161676 RepID=A0ABW5U097_9RHOB
MQDLISMLQQRHRPALLMRAARIGVQEYRRAVHLPRLLGLLEAPRPGVALVKLMEIEAAQESRRLQGDAGYSLARHLDALIALVGEARLLRASRGEAAPRQGAERRTSLT